MTVTLTGTGFENEKEASSVDTAQPWTSALQDTRLKWKGKVGKNDLTLKQHVPDGKWALVPNPGQCLWVFLCLQAYGTLEVAAS